MTTLSKAKEPVPNPTFYSPTIEVHCHSTASNHIRRLAISQRASFPVFEISPPTWRQLRSLVSPLDACKPTPEHIDTAQIALLRDLVCSIPHQSTSHSLDLRSRLSVIPYLRVRLLTVLDQRATYDAVPTRHVADTSLGLTFKSES